MTARTAADIDAPNDGSDDPTYQTQLQEWIFEGKRGCILEVLGIGILGLLLSRIIHWVLFRAYPEAAQVLNYWITFPTLGLVFWGMGVTYVMNKWQLSVEVIDNHSWVLIDFWPGRSNRKIKFPTGLYLIPSWWWPKPDNLTNHEDQTVLLPSEDYPAKGGEGAASVVGSFKYRVLFDKAVEFTKLDRSVIETGLVQYVKSQIGTVIANREIKDIVGQSVEVAREASSIFVGATRSPTEVACHVEVVTVTIQKVAPDDNTKVQLEKNQAATALKNRMKDMSAVIEDKDGKDITDPVLRFDKIKLAGIDPGRTITDDKKVIRYETDENTAKAAEALGEGFGKAMVLLAEIAGGIKALKGGKPGGKGPKGGK